MSHKRRGKSLHGDGEGALTPDIAATIEEHTTPDLNVEAFLFRSYIYQKERADKLAQQIHKLESILAQRGKYHRIKKFAAKLPIAHLDREARKGKL